MHEIERTLVVVPVPGFGAEDVLVATVGDYAGQVFTGTDDGVIHRIDPVSLAVMKVAETGGRPLGIEQLPDGALLVCDARRGLLRVDPATGVVETLATEAGGRDLVFCNNAAVGGDGRVWFTDSSAKFGIDEWKDDLVQHTRTGRLLMRTPEGEVQVALEGLAFANGVALAADESWVAVAETGRCCVSRLWLTGSRAGEVDYLVEALPGYPDNMALGSDGLVWIAIGSPRDRVVSALQHLPTAVSRWATRIPEAWQPKPQHTVRAQAYDEDGHLVHDVQVSTEAFHMVTGVRESQGRLWLASLHEPAVAFCEV